MEKKKRYDSFTKMNSYLLMEVFVYISWKFKSFQLYMTLNFDSTNKSLHKKNAKEEKEKKMVCKCVVCMFINYLTKVSLVHLILSYHFISNQSLI